MWKAHIEPRQSSIHPKPQKTCSLSGILEHTCNIQKSFERWVTWVTTHHTEGDNKQTNDKLSQGIQKASAHQAEVILRRAPVQCWLLAGTGNLNFRGCVCVRCGGVGCGCLHTQSDSFGMCFLPGVWDFVTHQADGAYETSHHKHWRRGSPDRHGYALLSLLLGDGVFASLWSDFQNFPFALPHNEHSEMLSGGYS